MADHRLLWFLRILFILLPLPPLLLPLPPLHHIPPLQGLLHHLLPHPQGSQDLQISCLASHRPLGKFLRWSLGPFFVLLFPDGINRFCSDDLPATLIQLLPVVIGSGVSSALILGVHADHWWVFANKSL